MRLSLLFCLLTLALFSSCLEDERSDTLAPVEGFSDPNDPRFSAGEFATLSAALDIEREVPILHQEVPLHLSRGDNDEPQSLADASKALLGRVLFYDHQLSATGETSCASCHKQELAFADDKAFSDGINGLVTKRNSLGLASVPSFSPAISGYGQTDATSFAARPGRVQFFWDERAATVSQQSVLTIQDEREMGSDLVELSNKLRQQEIYRILSVKAYGTPELTPERLTLALEKFCSSISAMNTRFDHLMDLEITGDRRQLEAEFSRSELNGHQLYQQNCGGCHGHNLSEPAVPVTSNGLDVVSADNGVGEILPGFALDGTFKVPFLRNVLLTAPYMHDGRFETLREVIEHYSTGIQNAHNLDHRLRDPETGNARKMNFTEQEIQDLLAFFALTTDETVAGKEELSDPFLR